MIERAPPLALSELKPGDALIVLSTEGATTSEVTAITVLSGVEPILAARPKGSTDVVLGPWNMGMGESGP
jgi:TusA-related sulfurtransferase